MKLIALATALLAQHSCGLSVPSSAQMTVEGHSDWSNGKKNVWVAETDHGWGAATDEVAEERVQQIIDEGKKWKATPRQVRSIRSADHAENWRSLVDE